MTKILASLTTGEFSADGGIGDGFGVTSLARATEFHAGRTAVSIMRDEQMRCFEFFFDKQ